MAYTAHVSGGTDQAVIIRDDRGVPAVQLTLPQPADRPEAAEPLLARAGWAPSTAWTATSDGWAAPVQQTNQGGTVS